MPTLVATPVAASTAQPPAPAGTPEAGEGGAPVGTTPPPVPEKPGQTFRAPEFGLHKAEDVKLSQDLRKDVEGLLEVTASHLMKYRDSDDPPRSLTQRQREFLALYTTNKAKLLDTAVGWSLAELVVEQEMLLRLAKLQKDIILDIKKIGVKGPSDEFLVKREELGRGFLNKYGVDILKFGGLAVTAPVSLPIVGIVKAFQSATTHNYIDVKIRLEDLNIDISALPQEYRDYIDYVDPEGIDPQGVSQFLLTADKARKDFYTALGAKPEDLVAATPWQRFRMRPGVGVAPATPADIEKARENLDTNWMRYRDKKMKDLVTAAVGPGGVALDLTNPTHVAWVMFQAQEATVGKFIEDRVKEIRETKPGEFTGSISQMEKTRDKIKSPQGLEDKRTKRRQELQDTQTAITNKTTELTQIATQIDTITRDNAKLVANQATLQAALDRLIDPATGMLTQIQNEITAIEAQRDTAIAAFDAQYAAVPVADPDAAIKKTAIADAKAQRTRDFEAQIEKKREREAPLKAKSEELRTQLNKIAEYAADLALLNPKKAALEAELKKLRNRVKKLEKIIESGLDPTEQKKVDQLEAAIQALSRYSPAMNDLVNLAAGNENISKLTERGMSDPSEGFGVAYRRGYLRTLELLFDYGRPKATVNAKDFFEAARTLLPPDKLAGLLARHFGVTIPAPAPADLLDHVYNGIQTNIKPLPQEFNKVFFIVFQEIENTGLRIS